MSKKKDVEDCIRLIKAKEFNDFIYLIREKGVLLSTYNNKEDSNIEEIIACLTLHIDQNADGKSKDMWKGILIESRIINKIYNNFYAMDEYLVASKSNNELESYILNVEKFLFYIYNQLFDKTELNKKYELNYEIKTIGLIGFTIKEELARVYDALSEIINSVLSDLVFYKKNLK